MAMPAPDLERDLHASLLDLHKHLLDVTRARYEKDHGPVGSPGEYLQLVIGHDSFAWLRPLSMLLVELDDKDILAEVGGARALAERTFSDGNVFYDRLLDILREHESLAAPHAEAMRALQALPARELDA
ncbi:MAG: uncharacterized protein JWP97_1737 [Labilithrix sp.]|nr:uncharacterized protein [Labilithrix sp.]